MINSTYLWTWTLGPSSSDLVGTNVFKIPSILLMFLVKTFITNSLTNPSPIPTILLLPYLQPLRELLFRLWLLRENDLKVIENLKAKQPKQNQINVNEVDLKDLRTNQSKPYQTSHELFDQDKLETH